MNKDELIKLGLTEEQATMVTEKYVNMSSSWFDLNVGQTEIGILTEPNNNISIDAKFKEAWQ